MQLSYTEEKSNFIKIKDIASLLYVIIVSNWAPFNEEVFICHLLPDCSFGALVGPDT